MSTDRVGPARDFRRGWPSLTRDGPGGSGKRSGVGSVAGAVVGLACLGYPLKGRPRYLGLIASRRPRRGPPQPPQPPQTRARRPPSLEPPPANRPWRRANSPHSAQVDTPENLYAVAWWVRAWGGRGQRAKGGWQWPEAVQPRPQEREGAARSRPPGSRRARWRSRRGGGASARTPGTTLRSVRRSSVLRPTTRRWDARSNVESGGDIPSRFLWGTSGSSRGGGGPRVGRSASGDYPEHKRP